MKKLIILLFLVGFISNIKAQTVSYGITQDGCLNKIIISVTSLDYDFVDVPDNFWGQGLITITWDKSYGQSIIGTISNHTVIPWAKNTSAGYIDYGTKWGYEFLFGPDLYSLDIANGNTVQMFTVNLTGSGFGTFTLENPSSNNTFQHGIYGETFWGTFNPSSISDVNLEPMIFWDGIAWCGGTGTSSQPGSSDGAKKCYIQGANAPLTVANAAVLDLVIENSCSLIINPGASLTANGPTTITSTYGLQLWADNTGVGSFIDNGTINYGTGAFAYIETHLSNSGTYYFHQVGPTVDNLPSGSGVTLADFDLSTSNTYAYEWDEPTQLWVNQFSETYPVNTGSGLLLTTNNGSAGDVAQKGSIINTNVALNLVLSGNPGDVNNAYGWNLKSNPYSAALDWDDVWTREYTTSNDLNPAVYVLNNGSSTYASYNANTDVGTGMTKDIQIGQGFWSQYDQNPYSAPGNVSFTLQPSDRNHSTAAFLKEGKVDQLTLTVSGNNSADVLAIAFRQDGTFMYDRFMDVDKWQSFWEEATEIWTVSNDLKDLTHNILPVLGNSNVSVPMSFECHAPGVYTISASDIESFQGNVEIYLEDLVTGGEWHDLVANPVYTFDAGEAGVAERFVVHFFGTTGIDDPDAYSPVIIYAWGQDAYIVNRGSETVKEYVAYDMMGRELHRGTLPNSTVNKVQIGDVSAYYVVKVITKEGRVYTNKVYINK